MQRGDGKFASEERTGKAVGARAASVLTRHRTCADGFAVHDDARVDASDSIVELSSDAVGA